MLPTAIVVNVLALAGIAIYSVFEHFSWQLLTGLLLGNVLFSGNMALMGVTINKTVEKKNEKSAQFTANASYGARYIGLFIIIGAATYFKLVEVIPTFIPLFIPKLHYTFEYIFLKKKEKGSKVD